MSLSFGSSKKKSSSSGQVDPWDVTIPALENLVGQIEGEQGNVGITPGQESAFSSLLSNANAGNPFASQISNLAGDVLQGVDSQSGTVTDAYTRLQDQIGGIAAGDNLDVNENPYLQQMLQQVGDNISGRINSQFAGAGRDLSGMNQLAVARGVSEGTLPTLFNQYNLERQNQSNAANQLFGAGTGTATTVQGLDTSALQSRIPGVEVANAAMDAQNWGPNTILALEQQMKQLPLEDLGRLEALLGPIAQLGQQQTQQSTDKGTSTGIGISNLFGGLGSLLTGSDERIKEDEEQVGALADGTPIYRYRYSEDPSGKMHIGVMAQDIEQDHPDAVAEIGGIKMVEYGAATDDAARLMKRKKKNESMPNSNYFGAYPA
jgi:hypothetical protein